MQSDLIYDTNDTTRWGMRFHPRKWDTTKTLLWSTPCVVKDQREQKVLDDVFVMLEVVGIESQFPIKRKVGQAIVSSLLIHEKQIAEIMSTY